MSYSSMLRRFGPAATLIAIRSAVNEPPAPRYTSMQFDPWFALDCDYRTAWAGVRGVSW